MLKPRNTRSQIATHSPLDLFKGFDTTLRHYFYDRPRAYWHVLRGRFENLPETNFKLGCEFAARGLWRDAVFRFKFAIKLEPTMVAAYYNLGCCYLQMQKRSEAYNAFVQVLKMKPDHTDARYMLSGLAPNSMPANQLPKTMPKAMVTSFFTQLADEYDALADASQYQGARLTAEACRPFLTATKDLQLVDLGCGTGLVARPWRGLCREMLGVDYTPAMVKQAQQARAGDVPVFNHVLQDDINTLAPGTFMPGASDVVLCVDTTQFLGDLTPLMNTAVSALKPGGLFVLSIDPYAAPHGFGVNPDTGRFGHTVEYVRRLAQQHRFDLKRDAAVPLYAEAAAHLFVFAKAAA